MKGKWHVTIILVLLVVLTGMEAYRSYENRQLLVYAENLSETAVTIDEKELTLFDIAFYVAYQEKEVQKDALIYNKEKPYRYWNAHTNGQFVRKVAEQAVVDMAVHDEIFYQIAVLEGLELDEAEEAYLANEILDFCSDVTEEQLAQLGVTAEDMKAAMRKIALANKYQSILSQIEGVDYTEYDYTGEEYQVLLEKHEVIVNEKIWSRISVGNITVNYKKKGNFYDKLITITNRET